MTARGRVVVVAYYAPPAVGIAANRLRGMVAHLAEAGWEPVVVAPEAVHHHTGTDAELPGGRIVRVPNPEPSRWLRWLGRGGRGEEGGADEGPAATVEPLRQVGRGSAAGLLRRLVRTWLYIPDARFPWIGPAARAAREAVAEAPGPVVLYSTSVPYSAHLAALRVARQTGVPWVAEYRDPWSAAPPQLGRRPWLRQLVDRRLDHSVVTSASRVVVTSEATRALFAEAFPELPPGSLRVVRNGWEGRVADAAPGPDEPLTLLYSGTLLSWRWAVPLLEALAARGAARAAAGGAAGLPGPRLRVLGPPAPWERAARGVPGAEDFLELPGLVPPDRVPGEMARASALVLLQPDEELGLYVAGKAYEYIGSRRPVLAWIPGEGEMARLVREHGELRLVDRGSREAFEARLEELAAEHRAGTLQGPRVPWERVEPLSRRAQARRLGGILDELAGRSGRPGSR